MRRLLTTWERIAGRVDRHPSLFLPAAIAIYAIVFVPVASRPLWYDEISTFHVANSPTFAHFVECLRTVELSPPLLFGLVRASIALFGDSPLAVRLPSLLGILAAGLILFRLASQRWGGLAGLTAMGLFWGMASSANAAEARPYGLLSGFLAAALYCWIRLTEGSEDGRHWTRWHTGLLGSIAAMFLTHCFSPFYAAAIGVGELVRAWRNRTVAVRTWIAILTPLALLPGYIPILRTAKSIHFPDAFQVDALRPVFFYVGMITPVAVLLVLLAIATVRHWRELRVKFELHEAAFGWAVLCAPFLLMAYSAYSRVPFWNRYGSPASVALCLLLAGWFSAGLRRHLAAAAGFTILVFATLLFSRAGTPATLAKYRDTATTYRDIRTDLPFVTASGLSFLEMDLHEPKTLAHRLVYLTDREAAIRYRHSTLFEGLSAVQRVFPLRGRVEPYAEFRAQHKEFLVFARPKAEEDWLLDKLRDDGATLRLLSEHKTPYIDTQIYQVRFER